MRHVAVPTAVTGASMNGILLFIVIRVLIHSLLIVLNRMSIMTIAASGVLAGFLYPVEESAVYGFWLRGLEVCLFRVPKTLCLTTCAD